MHDSRVYVLVTTRPDAKADNVSTMQSRRLSRSGTYDDGVDERTKHILREHITKTKIQHKNSDAGRQTHVYGYNDDACQRRAAASSDDDEQTMYGDHERWSNRECKRWQADG